MIDYARKLQSSENVQNSYIGLYSETNAYKEIGSPETEKKYEETLRFFRNAMIRDPSDMMAVTFRIQCYMDMGMYNEAEQLCKSLKAVGAYVGRHLVEVGNVVDVLSARQLFVDGVVVGHITHLHFRLDRFFLNIVSADFDSAAVERQYTRKALDSRRFSRAVLT